MIRTPSPDPPPGRRGVRDPLATALDESWSAWFDGLSVSHEGTGITVLTGQIADRAVLHGLLLRVRDLRVPLISVRRLDPH